MSTFRTVGGQTIYDIALQVYGDESFAVKIVNDNPDVFSSIDDEVFGGFDITFDENLNDTSVFVTNRQIIIATNDVTDDSGKAFDNSFTFAFN